MTALKGITFGQDAHTKDNTKQGNDAYKRSKFLNIFETFNESV